MARSSLNINTKHYLIVGGNTGIGAASVECLLGQGHQLTVASRRIDPDIASRVTYCPFDVETVFALGLPDMLDGLVYFPGTINLKPLTRLMAADYERDYRINVIRAVHAIQAALPALKRAPCASIVLFGRVAAKVGLPFHASIAAAKAAVEGLGRSLAAELAPKIRVNVISPSLTDTPLAQAFLNSEEKRRASGDRHPAKRVGDPKEMAALVDYLLGSNSSFVTGQVFRADGGLSSVRLL